MSIVSHKLLFVAIVVALVIVAIVVFQFVYIFSTGKVVPAPDIPRQTQTLGAGQKKLVYAVLGDSTSIGQGTTYDKGIARKTAEYLAATHTVELTNFGISGARVEDVLSKEVAKAVALKPDVVLLAIGANDVTHLTKLADIQRDLTKVITALQTANPKVIVILTGVPQMGSVPRFPWPTNAIARFRTAQVNTIIKKVVTATSVEFAPIADKTGPIFDSRPDLFAQDNFHPTGDGYAVWLPVLKPFFDSIR